MDKIWLKSYPGRRAGGDRLTRYRSLVHLLEESFQKYAERNAYVCMGKSLTYAELDTLSQRLGAWLQSRGLEKGARVAHHDAQRAAVPGGAGRRPARRLHGRQRQSALHPARARSTSSTTPAPKPSSCWRTSRTTLEQVLAEHQVKHVVVAVMGDLLGGAKGMIVNFVVRNVKKMVPAFSLPRRRVASSDALAEGSAHDASSRSQLGA